MANEKAVTERTPLEQLEQRIPANDCHWVKQCLVGSAALLEDEGARGLLEHISECESCGTALTLSEEHAERLLEIIRRAEPAGTDEQALEQVVVEAQTELIMFGRVLNERVRMVKELHEELPEELLAELPESAQKEPPAVVRLGVAVAELAHTIAAFLGTERGTVLQGVLSSNEGLTVCRDGEPHRTVPRAYFIARISQRLAIPSDGAEAIFDEIVQTVSQGKVGLPGLHDTSESSGESRIVVELEDVVDERRAGI